MDTERAIRKTYKIMELRRKGMLTEAETDPLSMVILAHHLKNTEHPEADEIIAQVLAFLLELDRFRPLHYSLWLAFAQLVKENPFDFFRTYDVQAAHQEYDPFSALSPVFYGSPFDDNVEFPVSVYSAKLSEEREACLARDDELSAAIRNWMSYEDELLRRANSFGIEDVLSFRPLFSGRMSDPDELRFCEEGMEFCLRYPENEGAEKQDDVIISRCYDDLITALSCAKPLSLYVIEKDSGEFFRYGLSRSEYRGFHVGMFLVREIIEKENKKIHTVLIDPKGVRYVLDGEMIEKYPNSSLKTKLLFPDGVTREVQLYKTFALMELNQGYIDLLKNS